MKPVYAGAQGQVMLVWPHQMWLTGITAGIILEVIAGFWNIWTMCAHLPDLLYFDLRVEANREIY